MNNIFNKISILAGVLAIFMVVIVTFWVIYPYKPIVVNKEPIEILTKEVGRGKPLTYRIDYCKNTNAASIIQKAYENDIIFPASTTQPLNSKGCRTVNVSQVVPYELPSGRYRMKIVFTYRVNPIRDVSVIAHTDYFNVTERD